MGDQSKSNKEVRNLLRPEVEQPYKPSNGLGLLFVAGASMFFAVASSAFIVRASLMRNAKHQCSHARAYAAAKWVAPMDQKDCGKAVFRTRADGTTSVLYKLCK